MIKSPLNQIADSESGKKVPIARRLAQLTRVGKTEINASINRSLDVGPAEIAQQRSIDLNEHQIITGIHC